MVKPHGLRGELVVAFVSNRPERVAPGAVLVTESGDLVLESARPFGARWLVHFEGVVTLAQAEALRATVLRGHPLPDDGALWVHELVGSDVVDTDGAVVGVVHAVVANGASDLLELEGGALVPLRFVVRRSAGQVVVDLPAGLLET
ncbi:MAG: PRC-barrel domain-containing protein [Acidimicrobiales bacterium]